LWRRGRGGQSGNDNEKNEKLKIMSVAPSKFFPRMFLFFVFLVKNYEEIKN
jgi:hypothetical protein